MLGFRIWVVQGLQVQTLCKPRGVHEAEALQVSSQPNLASVKETP